MPLRPHALRSIFARVGAAALLLLGWPAGPAQARVAPAASQAASVLLPVMVLAGQSNMIGLATNVNDLTPAQTVTQTSVLFYGPNENGASWNWLKPPTVTNNHFGPEISLGQSLVISGTNDLVAQVKYAINGSNLASDWDPDRPTDFLYAYMLARVGTAVSQLQAAYPNRHVFIAGLRHGRAPGMMRG